ncbi:MAG TPA: type I-E CRISPR-associated protein Cas7/Cse4/CasC [Tepidisphaeraceae bacterium]|jgi:CRISPR system Cascade subunit CasC
MFVQIHMLQSMPPGNLNRDETGQPKKCIFGGVTRGRISSQCLKRNIRLSTQFKEAFGGALAERTTYLPRMVADALRGKAAGVPETDLSEVMAAVASRFKKEKRGGDDEEGDESGAKEDAPGAAATTAEDAGQTGQLVFFPPPFAEKIAGLITALREHKPKAYARFLGRKSESKLSKQDAKALDAEIEQFIEEASEASKALTVDIGLFGRMTTSDLVLNVEAACQVAHAIGTHETIIESDYFTAMDDRKARYATTQADMAGAAFLGSGETETFYNSAVYYKYFNLDIDALRKHLPSLSEKDAAKVAGVLISAAALANPTGKQNSFASHSVPELILVEVSKVKRPVSFANAFLEPVQGANLMTESAKAFQMYVDAVAAAFAPADVKRVLLAIGHAKTALQSKATSAGTLDLLVNSVEALIVEKA